MCRRRNHSWWCRTGAPACRSHLSYHLGPPCLTAPFPMAVSVERELWADVRPLIFILRCLYDPVSIPPSHFDSHLKSARGLMRSGSVRRGSALPCMNGQSPPFLHPPRDTPLTKKWHSCCFYGRRDGSAGGGGAGGGGAGGGGPGGGGPGGGGAGGGGAAEGRSHCSDPGVLSM